MGKPETVVNSAERSGDFARAGCRISCSHCCSAADGCRAGFVSTIEAAAGDGTRDFGNSLLMTGSWRARRTQCEGNRALSCYSKARGWAAQGHLEGIPAAGEGKCERVQLMH